MAMELEDMERILFANGGELPVLGEDTCKLEVEEFDPSIWRDLPESVLYLVFSKLSLRSLIRIRSVSKLWMSTDFFTHGLQVRNSRDRFALVKKSGEEQELWIFDTPAQEWCKFRLGHDFPSPQRFSGPIAAASGLLCYVSETRCSTIEVMVGNPLTGTWRVLPPSLALCEFPTLTHMSMTDDDDDDDDDDDGQYSITLVGSCDDSGDIVIEVYDSISNAWRLTNDSPASYYNFFKGDEYQGLATIDRRSRTIKRLTYPAALQESSFLNRYEDKCGIVESQGSLFMCSSVPRKEGLWQRQRETDQWSKVCPFPKLLKKYEKTALFLSEYVVLLVGSEPHCFPPQFEDLHPHTMVMFNKVTQQWSILPNVSPRFGNVDHLLGGFMFEPQFHTKP